MEINSFRGKYAFLSNFYPAKVTFAGVVYPTLEHAFQAAKTLDLEARKEIREADTPAQAKSLGKHVKLRDNWCMLRVAIMARLIRSKFKNPELRLQLLATRDAILIEGNTWKDFFWGMCNGIGRNQLGELLMLHREECKKLAPL